MEDISISTIQKLNFKALPATEKAKFTNLARPTPDLNLHQQDKVGTRTFTRHFSKEIYKKFTWIAGCDKTNGLFCFPCVLFCSEDTDKIWSITGYRDLKHLNQKAKKHENSARHVDCCMELNLLSSTNIVVRLDRAHRQNVIKHNEQVTKNRYVLKKLINCIKFCGKLVLRGHDDKQDSQDHDILCNLVDFSPEIDTILKEHSDTTATAFKGTSTAKTIQYEILESMLAVCRQEIKQQINESDFLAIQCDETSDISNQCQMVIIVRYYHNGNLHERFWSFLKTTDNSIETLTQCIENEIDKLIPNSPSKLIAQTYDGPDKLISNSPSELIAQTYDGPDKLISSSPSTLITQTYDGPSMLGGPSSFVECKIKEKYKYAYFVHCYAHEINLIIEKATNQSPKVKLFFSNLSAIPAFFSNPTHRCDVLEETVNKKLLRTAGTCWNYDSQTINIVFQNRDELVECFKELEEKCNKTITCKEAYGLRRALEDPNFIYWLNFFHNIFPHVNLLFYLFQKRHKGSVELVKHLQDFEKLILSIRNASDDPEEETTANENKRRKLMPEMNYVIAKEVCDSIIFSVKERLSYIGHLEACSLVDMDNFLYYSQTFPDQIFKSVITHYHPILEHDKLKTELEVLYSSKYFKSITGVMNVLSWISENGLNDTFGELVKLLKILVTTPMTTHEPERCFTTLKRIKTFLRNTLSEERLNTLAMISVNTNFIHDISDFDEKVILHFISLENRGVDFAYKQ